MPKDISDLEFRIVRASEIVKEPPAARKQFLVRELANRFIDPETNQPICVGEGLEVGPFDSEIEGRNWLKYYLPDAYKLLNLGKEKTKGGHTKTPFSRDPRTRDGKVYFLLTRITE